jgi:pentatricopeptide repeat protein
MNAMSYSYIISCFANARKPRSALKTFHIMRKQGILANEHTYMSVLRALASMQDGFTALQVLSEMAESSTPPNSQHYAAAIQACVRGRQPSLAESIVALVLKQNGSLNVVLCTLYLRALLMQNKWSEANSLMRKMKNSVNSVYALPNPYTFKTLLHYQILAQHFEEALQNWGALAKHYSKTMTRVNSEGGMDEFFDALATGLGGYSSQAVRHMNEDQMYGRDVPELPMSQSLAASLPLPLAAELGLDVLAQTIVRAKAGSKQEKDEKGLADEMYGSDDEDEEEAVAKKSEWLLEAGQRVVRMCMLLC